MGVGPQDRFHARGRHSIGIQDAVVYANRVMEPAYFNPVLPVLVSQHSLGDRDNVEFGVDAAYERIRSVKLYGEFFLDDFTSPWGIFSNEWGNKLAFTAGALWIDRRGSNSAFAPSIPAWSLRIHAPVCRETFEIITPPLVPNSSRIRTGFCSNGSSGSACRCAPQFSSNPSVTAVETGRPPIRTRTARSNTFSPGSWKRPIASEYAWNANRYGIWCSG
jgi:hypothetical protein